MERSVQKIENGNIFLGIEFGSTRIKAVMTDDSGIPLAEGSVGWENHLKDGLWTYTEKEIFKGLSGCYVSLKENVQKEYNVTLKKIKAAGISAMMHGYLAFDRNNKLLVPFRTWRNSNAHEAAVRLTKLFDFNIPDRWSVAHLYQAVLNNEPHLKNIYALTTLSGMVHRRLTGKNVIGGGDASGMFPIDPLTGKYDQKKIKLFDELMAAVSDERGYKWHISDLLPEVLSAGTYAGDLTREGALMLDPDGDLEAGIPFCPPEGDAGTGMAATNSVRPGTGNVSAGTSIFAMCVLEHDLKNVHPEADMVTTPDGVPVAMIHANNCSSDINAWISVMSEFMERTGNRADNVTLYSTFFRAAAEGDPDCGRLLSYGFLSGENIMDVKEGRPLFVRRPDSRFTFANFSRCLVYSAFGAVKKGMDILKDEENIRIEKIYGHGGIFKTPGAAQQMLSDALNVPVSCMKTAGEGGPWGMALLAMYMYAKRSDPEKRDISLSQYLDDHIFISAEETVLSPDPEGKKGFESFYEDYVNCAEIEKRAAGLME